MAQSPWALMEADAEKARQWKIGSTLDELPEDLTHSQTVNVVLDRANALRQGASFDCDLISPSPDTPVTRLQSVVWKMEESKSGVPLLLVKSTERNSPWWIQEPLERDADGNLGGLARIGGEATPASSQFLIVLAFPNAEVDQKTLVPGASLSDLKQFVRGRIFMVTTSSGEEKQVAAVSGDSTES